MLGVVTAGPGSYLIEIRRRETPLPFVRAHFAFHDGTEKTLFIPALPHTSYLLGTHADGLRMRFDAAEVESVTLRRVGVLTRKFMTRRRRRSDRRYAMTIADETTPTCSSTAPRRWWSMSEGFVRRLPCQNTPTTNSSRLRKENSHAARQRNICLSS